MDSSIECKMRSLYRKYIQRDSDYAINIGYAEYQCLEVLFEGNKAMDGSAYYKVFDGTAIEVIRLLRDDSFRRFKSSKLFHQFVATTSLDLTLAKSLQSQLQYPQIRIRGH